MNNCNTSAAGNIVLQLILVAILSCVAVPQNSYSQVSIAPTALFFDNQNRFSSLMVSNGGQQAQEVSISTEFGYPTSQDGRLVIERNPELGQVKSIQSWLKVFPASFTLQPQQRQVVRFVIQPPQNLDAGGYWSRVKIASNPVSPPVEAVSNNQVGAQINLVVEQVISAHFRTPQAATGIRVRSIDFQRTGNTGIISVSTDRTGNAPFIGTLQLSVSNSRGETVYQTSSTTSVYTNITRNFRINLEDLPSDTYTIKGTLTSDRRDIDRNNLLHIQPVDFQSKFIID